MPKDNSSSTYLISPLESYRKPSISGDLGRPFNKIFHMTMPSRIENIPDVANSLVAHACRIPAAKKVGLYLGIYELLYNAIEHGNFGIDWHQREEAISGKKGLQNLYRANARVAEREGRKVGVKFESNNLYTDFTISDDGSGFDYRSHIKYILSMGSRNNIPQRGILNCLMRFDQLDYAFGGTVVRARKYHKISELQY